jgi:hypothetical protein
MMPKVDDDNTPQKDDAKGSGIADREKTPRALSLGTKLITEGTEQATLDQEAEDGEPEEDTQGQEEKIFRGGRWAWEASMSVTDLQSMFARMGKS